MSKQQEYQKLVQLRKHCNQCNISLKEGEKPPLVNPSKICGSIFDSEQIGPWSRWQGNLDAKVVVVGQDWSDDRYFIENKGFDKIKNKSLMEYENPTNKTLRSLLASIGIEIDPSSDHDTEWVLFFTNAILCLKTKGGMTGAVKDDWFKNCGELFLKPLIEIITPKVVIAIGEKAFRAVCRSYAVEAPKSFRESVEYNNGFSLPGNKVLFPVYHCGVRSLHMNRNLVEQRLDWARIKACLS
jgi:Uracil DNA glycosylase superfamily